MNSCGLNEQQLKQITDVLTNHLEVTGAYIFGSRAKGCYTDRSDIDIALEGSLSALTAQKVASELEELPFPQQFDVKAMASISSEPLLEHIARVGIKIY